MHSRFVSIAAGAVLALTSAASANAADMVSAGQLHCTVEIANNEAASAQSWRIELDDTVPLALVDDGDLPAEYSPSHVRIRFAIEGPVLTIGRSSGRILVTAIDGKPLGRGQCSPLIVASVSETQAG